MFVNIFGLAVNVAEKSSNTKHVPLKSKGTMEALVRWRDSECWNNLWGKDGKEGLKKKKFSAKTAACFFSAASRLCDSLNSSAIIKKKKKKVKKNPFKTQIENKIK